VVAKKVIVTKPAEVKKAAPVKPVVKSAPAPVVKPVPAPVVKATPVAKPSTTERTRFADAELEEFRILITSKLEAARAELINLQAQIINANENGTDDTGSSFKMLEDGSDTLAKEEAANLAARQKKFIEQLEAALIRIKNKTYGVCRVTGKLIPKERLRAVPHTTQSMEAKLQQYKD
jgi:RNA polymerase-binding transcription factor DksA